MALQLEQLLAQPWDLVVADDIFAPHAWAMALRLRRRGVPLVLFSTCAQLTAAAASNLALGRNPVLRPFLFARAPADGRAAFSVRSFWHRLAAFLGTAHEVLGFDLWGEWGGLLKLAWPFLHSLDRSLGWRCS